MSVPLLPGSYWWYGLPDFVVMLLSGGLVSIAWAISDHLVHTWDIGGLIWYWTFAGVILVVFYYATPYIPWTPVSWVMVPVGAAYPLWRDLVRR